MFEKKKTPHLRTVVRVDMTLLAERSGRFWYAHWLHQLCHGSRIYGLDFERAVSQRKVWIDEGRKLRFSRNWRGSLFVDSLT